MLGVQCEKGLWLQGLHRVPHECVCGPAKMGNLWQQDARSVRKLMSDGRVIRMYHSTMLHDLCSGEFIMCFQAWLGKLGSGSVESI